MTKFALFVICYNVAVILWITRSKNVATTPKPLIWTILVGMAALNQAAVFTAMN